MTRSSADNADGTDRARGGVGLGRLEGHASTPRWRGVGSEERPGGYYVANGGSGDRGSLLRFASALALDSDGSLYVANFYFHRVHRVRPDGVIETIAGNGLDFGRSPVVRRERSGRGASPFPHVWTTSATVARRWRPRFGLPICCR